MITDPEMRTLEGCCRMVIQKIAAARIADGTLRSVADNPKSYSTVYIRDIERSARFADGQLNTAIDELRDELFPPPKVNATAQAPVTTAPATA